MTEETHDPADERRGLDAVRLLDEPPAREEFRARLRAAFVAGTIAETETGRRFPWIAPIQPAATRAARPWFQSPAARWAALPLAAAAAWLVVVLATAPPGWKVASISGAGVAVIDNHPVPLGHAADLERWIRPGARVSVPDGAEIEIMVPGHMVVQLTGGTEAVIPRASMSGAFSGRLESGEVRVTTGRSFRSLALATPEAKVEVTGTTLAVIREPAGTCVCVFEGRVRVGPSEGAMVDVERMNRRFVFNDGREPDSAGIRDIEGVELGKFRDRVRPMMER